MKKSVDLDAMAASYRPVIYFRIRKALGRDNPDCEDIANSVLMQAVEKVRKGEFRGESTIGTFLYTITSRRIIDYIRWKQRVLQHAPEPSLPADPGKSYELQEREAHIAEAVKGLKPRFKKILQLYYYQGLSREDVAARLGVSPKKVSEQAHYAVKLIKKSVKR
ncbi:MAG: sigma-70 family RNA polymerase sigma factor [Acidobacteriota bacterium]|nr:sigma-70 family RNA polymerase sigma factor [Acidobacteriota bacterium]